MKDFEDLITTSRSSDYCVFGYETPNLGDCMQTLALLQHVRPRTFVLRDRLQPRPDLVLLANGWMTHGDMPSPNDFRAIRYAGIHLSEKFRTPAVADELRRFGPIGCRDTVTFEFLSQHGVPVSLTRCVTLTFPRYTGERRGIICVDIDDKTAARAGLKYAGREEVQRLSHVCDWLGPDCVEDGTLIRRMRDAYDRLQIYRKARLVVTTKVHVALPSIASGTPVVYIGPRDDRFGVFDGLDLGTGWESFRWFHVIPPKIRSFPSPVDTGRAPETYLTFLNELMARDTTAPSRVASS